MRWLRPLVSDQDKGTEQRRYVIRKLRVLLAPVHTAFQFPEVKEILPQFEHFNEADRYGGPNEQPRSLPIDGPKPELRLQRQQARQRQRAGRLGSRFGEAPYGQAERCGRKAELMSY